MKSAKNYIFTEYFDRKEVAYLKDLMATALDEDIGSGDITTCSIVPTGKIATGKLLAKQKGILCGMPLIPLILSLKTKKFKIIQKAQDGDPIKPGDVLAEVTAPATALLEVERVLLNYLQRLSGIATLTREFVDAVKSSKAAILDTRKTTPLCRILEKYAVVTGGGENHRFGLYDQVLIKDNHIDIAGGLGAAIKKVRNKNPEWMIEVEVRTLDELIEAIPFHPEIILLDNMTPAQMKKAVQLVKGKILLEASGGINLKNIKKIAATGVNRISIGAVTHSAPALDLSLKIKIN